MSAYIIARMRVDDPESYGRYSAQVMKTLEGTGGEFVVRGGEMEVIEGEWPYPRLVVLRFPTREAAKRWYDSPAYAAIRDIRIGASEGDLILVEGV